MRFSMSGIFIPSIKPLWVGDFVTKIKNIKQKFSGFVMISKSFENYGFQAHTEHTLKIFNSCTACKAV